MADRRIKKIKGILCLILAVSVLLMPVYAAGPVVVSMEDAVAVAGERVEVIVSLSGGSGVSGASFTVICHSEDMKLSDIQPIAGGSFSKNLEKGSFSWLKGTDVKGSFQLVRLIFDVSADAEGDYRIDLMLTGGLRGNLTNSRSEEVEAVFKGTTITVSVPSGSQKPGTGGDEGDKPAEPPECDGGSDCPASPFSDVDTDKWYHGAVDFVMSEGLMNGVGEGLFAPSATASRAMTVTILYRMAGSPAVSGESGYGDVAAGKWYSEAVKWATDEGIVNGYGGDIFAPHYPVTREQAAVLFHRFAKSMGIDTSASAALDGFEDAAELSFWAEEAMCWAVGSGLIEGRSATELAPGGTATRAELAALIMRWCTQVSN